MQNICAADFFTPTKYNCDTKNQIWMSIIADGHDGICDCNHPFAHMLSSIFPPGHQDRNLTINQILERDYKEKCLSGGDGAADHGLADAGGDSPSGDIKQEEEDYPEEELEGLIAAAEERGAR
jgi:hypothetical protein